MVGNVKGRNIAYPKQVSTRLGSSEYEELLTAAAMAGKPVSVHLRDLVLQDLKREEASDVAYLKEQISVLCGLVQVIRLEQLTIATGGKDLSKMTGDSERVAAAEFIGFKDRWEQKRAFMQGLTNE